MQAHIRSKELPLKEIKVDHENIYNNTSKDHMNTESLGNQVVYDYTQDGIQNYTSQHQYQAPDQLSSIRNYDSCDQKNIFGLEGNKKNDNNPFVNKNYQQNQNSYQTYPKVQDNNYNFYQTNYINNYQNYYYPNQPQNFTASNAGMNYYQGVQPNSYEHKNLYPNDYQYCYNNQYNYHNQYANTNYHNQYDQS